MQSFQKKDVFLLHVHIFKYIYALTVDILPNLTCRFVNLQQSILADTKDAVNALVRYACTNNLKYKP